MKYLKTQIAKNQLLSTAPCCTPSLLRKGAFVRQVPLPVPIGSNDTQLPSEQSLKKSRVKEDTSKQKSYLKTARKLFQRENIDVQLPRMTGILKEA